MYGTTVIAVAHNFLPPKQPKKDEESAQPKQAVTLVADTYRRYFKSIDAYIQAKKESGLLFTLKLTSIIKSEKEIEDKRYMKLFENTTSDKRTEDGRLLCKNKEVFKINAFQTKDANLSIAFMGDLKLYALSLCRELREICVKLKAKAIQRLLRLVCCCVGVRERRRKKAIRERELKRGVTLQLAEFMGAGYALQLSASGKMKKSDWRRLATELGTSAS